MQGSKSGALPSEHARPRAGAATKASDDELRVVADSCRGDLFRLNPPTGIEREGVEGTGVPRGGSYSKPRVSKES